MEYFIKIILKDLINGSNLSIGILIWKKYRDPHKCSILEHPRILAYSILILSQQYWLTKKIQIQKGTLEI